MCFWYIIALWARKHVGGAFFVQIGFGFLFDGWTIFWVYAAWLFDFHVKRFGVSFFFAHDFNEFRKEKIKGMTSWSMLGAAVFHSVLLIFFAMCTRKDVEGAFFARNVLDVSFWWGDYLFAVCRLTHWCRGKIFGIFCNFFQRDFNEIGTSFCFHGVAFLCMLGA